MRRVRTIHPPQEWSKWFTCSGIAVYEPDPYMLEIHGEVENGWFCDHLYRESADEI